MKKPDTKKIVRTALFTALALIMSLIENSFPPLLAFAPGVKMGLANVISLIAVIILGVPEAYIILLVRCTLGSIFAGNVSAMMYSVPAGFTALTVQVLLYRFVFARISLMAISLCGAVIHNITQLFIASLILKVNLLAVLPLTLAASVIAGLFVGIVTYITVRYLPKKVYL